MNTIKKTIVGFIGIALVLSLAVVASPAKADQISDLMAQISALTAQINALKTGSTVTAGTTFTRNLTVGSSGADVTALQNFLIAKGNTIAAGATGYFGSQTKAALAAYQAANGISPAAGYFGPITMAKVNGSATVGGTPTTGTPVVTADGSDGSITLSSSSFVTSSQTLKKGDLNKPIIAARAQATAGAVTVTRFDVHFSSRPWLVFSSLSLTDSSGKVLATKALNSSADATEVTVGSDYLVRFEGVNAVVTPGTDVTFVVNANVQSASDKITGQTVTVTVPAGSVRTINGKGYTDSLGGVGTSSITLSSTGSSADAYTRLSPSTPDTQTVNISTTNVTSDQVLGVFDVKVQNQTATVNGLTFNINNGAGVNSTTLFQNVRLYQGSTLVGGATSFSAANPGVAVFSNITLPLSQDTWTSLTLKADVIATSSSFSASSTLVSAGIVGVDANYNTIALTNASNRTSNDVTFVPNAGLTITNIVVTKGSTTFTQGGLWTAAYPTIAFTINNTGNNPIYISKLSGTAITFSTTSGAVASTTITNTSASGSVTGDTANAYIINGSRTFTYSFTADNTNGTSASRTITITAIKYGTGEAVGTASGQNAQLTVNYGLTTATVTVP